MKDCENYIKEESTLKQDLLTKFRESGVDESFIDATLVLAEYLVNRISEKVIDKVTATIIDK